MEMITPVPPSIASRIYAYKRLLTAEELAGFLSLSEKHVFRLAKTGRVPCIRLGGAVRFDPKATGTWLRQNCLKARPAK